VSSAYSFADHLIQIAGIRARSPSVGLGKADCGNGFLPVAATRRPQAADREPGGFACRLVLESRSRSGGHLEPVKPPGRVPGLRQGGPPPGTSAAPWM